MGGYYDLGSDYHRSVYMRFPFDHACVHTQRQKARGSTASDGREHE